MRRSVVIAGAAGRDFHNFNVAFRGRDDVRVVAFTATQIPDIEGRVYPAELAGTGYPDGIPIVAEEELADLVRREEVDEVVFAYSDVTHEHVMHIGSTRSGGRRRLRPARAALDGAALVEAGGRDLRRPHGLREEPDDPPCRRGAARRRASASRSSATRCPTAT